ncbi:amidohydrolase [Actinobacteria bacterium YIM 96077]|uniref:Amidohydrolase n=1 Tax=Phytoactinopolyspora halophila TaxID=1981511 RepID=A0A329QVE8_9ACTN|nr:M20 family metallopeptidase [Phytoactinopolyspora halophila]AYY13827.1 amidohydrolase [Actinobacteria bacterium YIM 96077]RAW15629.1 amidohydrolase [Phytoactinopolyspora halophila]
MTSTLAAAEALAERTRAFRRKLHQHPEIGLDLPVTRQAVLDEIADLGLTLRLSETTSSIVAELDGAYDGPTLILRGDMDALPLREDTGLPFASQVPGAMHACGHDTHVAMLASAARLLAGRREELAGRVLFFFQPGEEGYHGAHYALAEGLLDNPTVNGAFALHISAQHECGTINIRPGPLLAAADNFQVTLTGRGGHASSPHRANDPVPAACEIVTTLQVALSRRVDVFDPAVLTVGQITGGTADNIIPATAELRGTIRTLSEETRTNVHERLRVVADGIAAAHELSADVTVIPGYPATVNDPAFTDVVRTVASETLGAERVQEMGEPLMGAEDFSYVLGTYPGAMAFLGACPAGTNPGEATPNHSNLVVFDESALATGVATYAAVALNHLRP